MLRVNINIKYYLALTLRRQYTKQNNFYFKIQLSDWCKRNPLNCCDMNKTTGLDADFPELTSMSVQLRQKQDINVGRLRGMFKSEHQQFSRTTYFPQLFNLTHIGHFVQLMGLVID